MGKRSARDIEILAAVTIAAAAFQASGKLVGAADISHLCCEDIARGEELMETVDEATLRAALASVEADIASVSRPS
jgi:hypothetical protein